MRHSVQLRATTRCWVRRNENRRQFGPFIRLRHSQSSNNALYQLPPAQVQALLGTSARYLRAGTAEYAAVIERIFDYGPGSPRSRP